MAIARRTLPCNNICITPWRRLANTAVYVLHVYKTEDLFTASLLNMKMHLLGRRGGKSLYAMCVITENAYGTLTQLVLNSQEVLLIFVLLLVLSCRETGFEMTGRLL